MSEEIIKCTFCSKSDKEVLCLVATPKDVFICDECVEIARDLVGIHRNKGNKAAISILSDYEKQS